MSHITLHAGLAEWLASARVGDRVDVRMSDGTERAGKIESVKPGQVVVVLDGIVHEVSATLRVRS